MDIVNMHLQSLGNTKKNPDLIDNLNDSRILEK